MLADVALRLRRTATGPHVMTSRAAARRRLSKPLASWGASTEEENAGKVDSSGKRNPLPSLLHSAVICKEDANSEGKKKGAGVFFPRRLRAQQPLVENQCLRGDGAPAKVLLVLVAEAIDRHLVGVVVEASQFPRQVFDMHAGAAVDGGRISSHAKVMGYSRSSRFALGEASVIRHRSSVIGPWFFTDDLMLRSVAVNECRMRDTRYGMQDTGCRMQDVIPNPVETLRIHAD